MKFIHIADVHWGARPEREQTFGRIREQEIKETFPNKTIWLYTGFCWDEIKTLDVVKYCDVIVDGPFVQEEFDGKLHWKGSKNQRVIDVQETLRGNEIVLHEF